jgi:hypothetical protein
MVCYRPPGTDGLSCNAHFDRGCERHHITWSSRDVVVRPRKRSAAPSMRYLTACLGIFLSLVTHVSAVIIASGDGSGNTTAPPDDPGFANVGIRGSGTASISAMAGF